MTLSLLEVILLESSILRPYILPASVHMKDLGALTYILGIKLTYAYHSLGQNQTKYICDIICEANLTDDKVAYTHMEVNVKYKKDN